ncbi:MAG: tetratricopeptide repeat protein [Xanthomonadales bacterium]|nr:tetratricopeptide repeat protein [Xanthomonadales bacterium]
MDDSTLNRFQALLDGGQDNALLRLTLGQAWLEREDYAQAVEHLERSVQQNPGYSAAWKFLGKAREGAGMLQAAREAYQSGLSAARQQGDAQLTRELEVFLKRLAKRMAEDNR